jgi:DNA polymerase III alpha subunit (gram-positive type)
MYLFIDTETGGLTPRHSLLTVSCIGVDEKFNIIPAANGEHGLYLKLKHEEYALTAGALSVNKIDVAQHHATAMTVQDAKHSLLRFIDEILRKSGKKRLVPAGHNVGFDVQFIRANLLTDSEWDNSFTYPAFDTAAIARFLNAAGQHEGGYSLGRLRDKYIPHMGGNLHNAETDNLTTIELAKKFVSLL